jgi:hypothetical protein
VTEFVMAAVTKRRVEEGNAKMVLEQKETDKMQYQGTSSCAGRFAACGHWKRGSMLICAQMGAIRRFQMDCADAAILSWTGANAADTVSALLRPEIGMKWP